MASISTLRTLVDKALQDEGTTLEEFIAHRQANGKSIRVAAQELEEITEIPIAWRTLYRWVADLESVAS